MGGHLQHPLWCHPWEAWYEGHWPLPHKSDLLALSQSPGSLWTYKSLVFAPDFSTGSPAAPRGPGDRIPQVCADQFVCKFAL